MRAKKGKRWGISSMALSALFPTIKAAFRLTTKTEVVFRKKGKKLPNHRFLRLVSDVGQILSLGDPAFPLLMPLVYGCFKNNLIRCAVQANFLSRGVFQNTRGDFHEETQLPICCVIQENFGSFFVV